jgi:uncharacterized ferritin-like protein (DUF455 family)
MTAPHLPHLRAQALAALCLPHPAEKCAAVQALFAAHAAGATTLNPAEVLQPTPEQAASLPGRPALPLLVHPGSVPQRSPHTPEGLAALVHAICHIEFNAINLALDAVWRFPGMPANYYTQWLQVAQEEATHFGLLQELLQSLPHPAGQPYGYGSFPAHDGLWAMCEKTAHSITARMALVPRTLEARGLDATPLIQAKLHKVGTPHALRAVEILHIILRDEVGHVAVGNHWYGWLCQQQGLQPLAHYRQLARQHQAPRLKPPFNHEARRRAGFTEAELDALTEHTEPLARMN